MSKELVVPEIDDRTRKLIWKGMLTKQVSELAEQTGLTREEIIYVRNSMLENVDALTIDQERQKIMVELHQVAERAKEEFESTTDARSKAPLLSAHISAMKLLLTQLKELEKAGNSQVDSLNELRQKEMVSVLRDGMDNFLEWLEEEHGIEVSETAPIAGNFVLEAARKLDERNEPR